MEKERANILIVDDRQDKRLAFSAILEELGEPIYSARSGEEALKLMLERDFAVVLLDVNMPGLDGLETAALIRQRKRTVHTPIIFITAYADDMLTMRGYALGAVDYILSPITPDILRTKVKVFVDLHRMTQQVKREALTRAALEQEQAARAAAEAMSRRSDFLAHASKALFQSLDADGVIHELFSIVLPSVADVCIVQLAGGDGFATSGRFARARTGTRPRKLGLDTISPSLIASMQRVFAGRNAEVIYDPGWIALPSESTDRIGIEPNRSQVVLSFAAFFPLVVRERTLGLLCFGIEKPGHDFTDDTLFLAKELADRTALALDNSRLYQELQLADRQKNEFMAVLGHELRNPLAPIRNAVEVMRLAGPERLNWARNLIERQVKTLARLVDELLDVSRITQGTIHLTLAPVEVSAVVAAALETNAPLIDSRKHRLTTLLPPQPVFIKADAARMSQVIGNLLNNAAKYTPEGGRIEVRVTIEEDRALLRVIDSGIGIRSDVLPTIFEIFKRGDGAPDTVQEGLGVGLTLARRLVEMHGGTLRAHSPGPGAGSEFVVSVPVLKEGLVEPVESEAPEPEQSLAGLSILVVDDNHDAAESTAQLLQMKGCDVRVAHDGAAALKTVRTFQPDAVLLDLGLPGMDGYEVASRLRAMPFGKRLLIIAASGYGHLEARQRSAKAGFDAHLIKPLDLLGLHKILASMIATDPQKGSNRKLHVVSASQLRHH